MVTLAMVRRRPVGKPPVLPDAAERGEPEEPAMVTDDAAGSTKVAAAEADSAEGP
ncbi:hypothetical protein [Actinomyces procaprae]|uniref:hypothetical protein n=1 Tax=Actinomyces procaprae TaxID=2560010 RepID=UPI0014463774|nr:hypothetical protein [Actinomyces procaprae]